MMFTTYPLLLLGALAANASPLDPRQNIEFDLVKSVLNPTATVVLAFSPNTTAHYDLAAATQEAITLPLTAKPTAIAKRGDRGVQPAGYGPGPEDDTIAAFRYYREFAKAAMNAPVPEGYKLTFKNLKAGSKTYGYLGHSILEEYDPGVCAAKCDTLKGCTAFNIYFERIPAEPDWSSPPSSTAIKCVLYGGYIFDFNARHERELYKLKFEIVVAGSNGYMKDSVPEIESYTGISLGDATIDAPRNCNGEDTYLGAKLFTSSYFDPGLCAAACSDHEGDRKCRFFTTFVSHVDRRPQGQYCALYTQRWDKSFATNIGQWRGENFFAVNYAFAYWITDDHGCHDPGCPDCSCPENLEEEMQNPEEEVKNPEEVSSLRRGSRCRLNS